MLADILEDANIEDGQTSTSFDVTKENDEVNNITDIVFSEDEDEWLIHTV